MSPSNNLETVLSSVLYLVCSQTALFVALINYCGLCVNGLVWCCWFGLIDLMLLIVLLTKNLDETC